MVSGIQYKDPLFHKTSDTPNKLRSCELLQASGSNNAVNSSFDPCRIRTMLRSTVTFLGWLLIVSSGYAQVQLDRPKDLYPVSTGEVRIPEYTTPPFDQRTADLDDSTREQNGALRLYGRFVPVDVNTTAHGSWNTLANGDKVWRIRIRSSEALATELFFRNVQLAEGARLDVFDERGDEHFGGYTQNDVGRDGSFSTPMVHGASCIVTYSGPDLRTDIEAFTITALSHAYRDVVQERSGSCEVDVNCSEGAGYETVRDAVVRIRVVVPAGTGRCTGTLMNNTDQDCKPYVLTAMHCGQGSTEDNFNNYQFFFNYQHADCSGSGGALDQVINGCVKRAGSNDIDANGRAQGSDFLLLEMNAQVPPEFNAFFAGWDATGATSNAGRCIHHPDGDVKKVSSFSTQTYSAVWGTTLPDTHWRVAWTGTANGHGVTEPGSSGASLVNASKRVIGTLTGGFSCCTLSACGPMTGPNQPDYFGKFSQHWTGNLNPANEKLKFWLAPNSTALTLDGAYDPCSSIGIAELFQVLDPHVFPNPATDHVTITWPVALTGIDRVVITDLTGRIVHNENTGNGSSLELNVGNWSPGIYVITLEKDGLRVSCRRLAVR